MAEFEKHHQWSDVKDVCGRLRKAGYRALLAGGAVRDLLMKRVPNDFDVATDATPDQVEALFEKSVAVGKAFGVIVLPFTEHQIEVATFREDLEYKDGRRPEGVKFSTPEGDAKRRDFTINALFLDPETGEVLDFVGGRADIEKGLIRTVGIANQRFDEDKLRILRAIRFSAQLGFEIDGETLQSIEDRAPEVAVVSRERIRDELLKLLKAKHRVRGIELLQSTRVLESAFPEIAPFLISKSESWIKSFESLETENETALLGVFLAPAFKTAGFTSALKNLRLENSEADRLTQIERWAETVLQPSSLRFGALAQILTKPWADELLAVADAAARAGLFSHEAEHRALWNKALKAARPDGHTPQTPLVQGKDLLGWGVKPGPKVGELLNEIFLLQLEGQLNSRDEVEAWVRRS